VLDWDHNAYYHRLLLRQMPQRCRRVLDVGCGAGAFAARLAQRSEQVDALDRSAEMIEEAKRRTPGNLNCVLADVLADPLPGTDYDAIFSVSALHHMPLRDSLPVLEAALRPGGVLAAIALPRPDLRHELPAEIVAAAGHRLLGAMFLAKRSLGSNGGFAKDSTRSAMPVVMDPPRHLVVRQGAEAGPGRRHQRPDHALEFRTRRTPGQPQDDQAPDVRTRRPAAATASVSCSLPEADRSEDLSQLPAGAGKWRRVIGGGELAPAGRFVS
jgi:SAM-dependent methyltransferase